MIGKGNKERLVLLGEEAVYWLETYLEHGRPWLLNGVSIDVLFPASVRSDDAANVSGIASSITPHWRALTAKKLSPHTCCGMPCDTSAEPFALIRAWCRCC